MLQQFCKNLYFLPEFFTKILQAGMWNSSNSFHFCLFSLRTVFFCIFIISLSFAKSLLPTLIFLHTYTLKLGYNINSIMYKKKIKIKKLRQSLLLQQFCKNLYFLPEFFTKISRYVKFLKFFPFLLFSLPTVFFCIFIISLSFAKSLLPTLILLRNSH